MIFFHGKIEKKNWLKMMETNFGWENGNCEWNKKENYLWKEDEVFKKEDISGKAKR